MPAKKSPNLSGSRFGRLVVLFFSRERKTCPSASRPSGHYRYHYMCRCDCGGLVEVCSSHLQNGDTSSCGCLQRERASVSNVTHGATVGGRSLAYNSWLSMRSRCDPKNKEKYPTYAGVVAICPEWQDFDVFVADMGECPSGHSLDRIDNDGNYEPTNCRWASYSTQAENRRSTRFYTHNGQTLCMKRWAEKIGISRTGLKYRMDNLGWPIARALSEQGPRRKTDRWTKS